MTSSSSSAPDSLGHEYGTRPAQLAGLVSPSVERDGCIVVPVGSIEQHGPHLPLDTDTVIASAVADRVAARIRAVVTPAVAFGSSGEHQSFAGTLSIGTPVLTSVLVELARSATEWAGRVVFINGHGGNVSAVRAATDLLQSEGRDATWAPCASPGADAHAGRTETSLMLHLDPARVRLQDAVIGNTAPIRDLIGAMSVAGVGAVSPNGVLGDPTGASAGEGAAILAQMVDLALARLAANT